MKQLLESGARDADGRKSSAIVTKGLQHSSPLVHDLPCLHETPRFTSLLEKSKLLKNPDCVWGQEQPCANFPNLRRSLPNNRLQSELLEGNRQRESANATPTIRMLEKFSDTIGWG